MSNRRKRLGLWGLSIGAAAALAAVALWPESQRMVLADKAQTAGPDNVLAVVEGVQITREEVEAANPGEFLDLDAKRHALLERGLDQLIADRLTELEAAARGVSVDDLLAGEVEASVSPPSDEEVEAFYEAQKAQIRGTLESVGPQIREYLTQQRRAQAYHSLVESLRAKYAVKTLLEPMRIPMESAGFPARGPESAQVTIVEFSDFECPFCSRVVPTLERIQESYPKTVRLVFRQFPLHAIHPHAQKAAEASLCAHDQDRFWEMHDTMFKEQKALSVEQLKQKAARLGLDGEAFTSCLDSGRHAGRVAADLEAGRRAGVTGTPAIFINGRFLSGAQPYEEIAKIVDDELQRASSAP